MNSTVPTEQAIAINMLDREILNFSAYTLTKLLTLGENALILYIFYSVTAKNQSNKTYVNIVNIYATDTYCMKGLNWGKDRFYSAKKILLENKFIEKVEKRDNQGKIVGHYIKINYLFKHNSIQSTCHPDGGFTPLVGKQETNTSNINILNTKKTNINTVDQQENNLPIIQNGYRQNSELNTKKPRKVNDEPTEEAKLVLEAFNQTYGTTHKAVTPILGNLKYWLKTYTVEDICKAIKHSKHDKFWKDKLTPVVLLRQKNPNQEAVDYIGQFLNMAVSLFDDTPLTDLEQWELAGQLDIHPQDVARKHRAILEEASQGGNVTQRYKDVRGALAGWLKYGIEKGEIETLGDFREHILREAHPEFRKKLAEAKALLKAQGKL